MTSRQDPSRKFTTHQVAKLLGVSDQSVANWVDAGKLKASRTPGGHRRIEHEDLVAFLTAQNVPIPAELKPDSMTILVVDDEAGVADVVAGQVRSRFPNHTVVTANDGFAAGRLVSDLQPQLVILDLFMPGLDGFEVCRRIKDDPRTASIQVIAMTAHHTSDTEQTIIEAGAEACFAKPVDLERLATRIGELLV